MTYENRTNFRIRGAAILVLLGMASGCGRSDDLPRQPISGQVSLDGQPLDKAWIEFRPEGEGGVTMAASMIEAGAYNIPLDEGLIPGKYRVSISKPDLESKPLIPLELKPARKGAAKKQPVAVDTDPYAPRIVKQLIPVRYNTQSEIVEEVKADQPNHFTYELTSK